jgi:hypothetical protein
MSADDADDADDAAATVDAATSMAAAKRKRRKKGSGNLGRNKRSGDRKNSTTHHLPRPPKQSQAPDDNNNNNNTEDTRVWNMKRTVQRRDKAIEAAANENKQLKRKIESVNNDMQLVQQECDKKVRDVEATSAKLNKRSYARMSAAAAATTKAKAKDA